MAEAKIRLAVEGASLVKTELDRVGSGFNSLANESNSLKTTLLGLVGGLSVGAFVGMIRGSIDAADSLNDLRKSTGLTIETLSGLKLASKQSGADLEGTAAAINKLSVNIGKNSEKFAALGVTAKDPLEAFKQLSDIFISIDDPQLKAAVGAEALGKSWASAAPLLMEGGDAIQNMVDKGAKLAGVNTEMAEAADAFNDKLAELTGTGGLMNSMTASLLPLLNLVVDELITLRDESKHTDNGFSVLAETFRALIVLGGNVTFTFKGVGREIGGVAAQLAAFGAGDFKGALAIGDMMKSDAATARKEFDAWENKVMTAGKRIAGAYSGYTSGQNEPKGVDAATTAAQARARAFLGGDKGGAGAAEKISEYTRMEEAIKKVTLMQEQELLYGGKLAASDKFRTEELQKITFAFATHKISQQERLKLIGLTSDAVAKMYLVEKQAYEQDAIKKNTEALDKQLTSMNGTIDGLIAANEQQRLDNEMIGLTVRQTNSLILARQDAAIASKQLELATASSNGADAAAIALMEREIVLLGQKRGLTAEQQTKTELSLELKGFDATAAQLESLANITGKMGDGFKKATAALGGFAGAFKNLATAEKNEKLTSDERFAAQIGGYGDMVGAAAEFFDKNSEGYELLKTAEQGFRAFELAMSIQSMVQKATEATTKIAANGTIAASGVMAGAGEMFAALGPFGFPAVAAMLAVMASLGFGGSGSSGTFGTAGAGNQIGADGRKRVAGPGEDMNAGTNYNNATGRYDLQNKPQKTEQEMIDFANAAAIDAAANAVANLKIEAMKLTKGSEELEKSLARARLAASGMGIAQHELATQGMNEAELASYNYNQALRAQISVQMDIANGTELTSENMRKLAGESQSLAIELMTASGDIAGARALQRQVDTASYTKEEVAVYDHNQAVRDQIEALNAGASAAREAAQAEQQLEKNRYDLAGKLDVLLGRKSQKEVDRAAELLNVTDETVISLTKMIHVIEDLKDGVDKSFETLKRAVEEERKTISGAYKAAFDTGTASLKSASDLFNALKTSVDGLTGGMTREQAKSQLDATLNMARMTGRLPTAESLGGVLQALSANGEASFKTAAEYKLDQAKSTAKLSELARMAAGQASIEQRTLDVLKENFDAEMKRLDGTLSFAQKQLDKLNGIDTSVISVADAVKGFDKSLADLATAVKDAPANNVGAPSGGGGSGGGVGGGGGGTGANPDIDPPKLPDYDISGWDEEIIKGYLRYYNRYPDIAGYKHFDETDLHGERLMQAILGASAGDKDGADYKRAVKRGYNPLDPIAKFANGGSFGGGLRLVGELGPELEATGASRITSTNELLSRLQSPQQSNAELVAELRAIRGELSTVKTELTQIKESNKKMKDLAEKDDAIGSAPARAVL